MLREDLNQPFWKEKFIAGLPSIIGEKVKTRIREQYSDQIPYSSFTYCEFISFTQQEGLKACRDLQFHRKLQKEMTKTGTQLGAFCSMFDISKDYCKDCTKPPSKKTKTRKSPSAYKKEAFYEKPKRRYSRNYSSRTTKPTPKPETSSKIPKLSLVSNVGKRAIWLVTVVSTAKSKNSI